MAFSREQAFREARQKLKQAYAGKDAVLVHTVNSIEEMDKVANLFVERLREWYGIYFPELKVSDPEAFCRIVVMSDRSSLDEATLADAAGPEKAKEIIASSKSSVGADFSDEDLKEVRALASEITSLYALRAEISEYQSAFVRKMAPNLCHLVEPALAAKLIAQAGSLRRLAFFPASTVQVLGAEKALFKHLKKGTLPPKYGLIFQHPAIGNAPPAHAGKLARALATKLAIAAKADALSHHFIADKLKADFEKRAAEIATLSKEKKPGAQRPQQRPPFRQSGFRPQQGRPQYGQQERRPSYGQKPQGQYQQKPQGQYPQRPPERKPQQEQREGRPQGQQGVRPQYPQREGRPQFGQREGKPYGQQGSRPQFGQREERPQSQRKPGFGRREERPREGGQGGRPQQGDYPQKKRFNKFRRGGRQ